MSVVVHVRGMHVLLCAAVCWVLRVHIPYHCDIAYKSIAYLSVRDVSQDASARSSYTVVTANDSRIVDTTQGHRRTLSRPHYITPVKAAFLDRRASLMIRGPERQGLRNTSRL